jgi:release factor glutamine methyltransferase
MTTLADALQRAERALAAAGVPNAVWDAELLVRHVLGCDRASLLANPKRPLSNEESQRLDALVSARGSRRPLQHLTGVQAFWRHEFRVTPDVLIPRPESELLVEATLALVRDCRRPLIVDVGTGSGCLALSIATERPDAELHATDVSPAALDVARENARRLGCAERVTFHQGDLLAPVARLAGRIDVVLSNPPYVDPRDAASLPPEVRDYEPATALFPEGDACSVYRDLAPQAYAALRKDGAFVVEIGLGMETGVRGILSRAGFRVERVLADMQSIPRALVAVRDSPQSPKACGAPSRSATT